MAGELVRQIKAAVLGGSTKAVPPSGLFLKSKDNVRRLRFRLDENFIAFQGHFAGHPVLPALAQVLLARETASAISARALYIESIIQGKFLSLVEPGGFLSVYAQSPPAAGSGEWRFHLTHSIDVEAETDASFLRLVLTDRFKD